MTALNRIVVKGFKSIKEMDLELRNLNVLIGANGSGKSNFLAVFRLLNEVVKGREQYFAAKSGGANILLHFGSKITSELFLQILLGDFFGPYVYQCKLEATADDSLIVASQHYQHTSPLDSNEMEQSQQEVIFEELKDVSKAFKNALERWHLYHFNDTSDSAKVKLTGDIRDNYGLRPDASNLAAMLYLFQRTKPDYYDRIVKTIQLVAPFFEDFALRPVPENPDTIILRWRERGSDIEWYASSLSDGTLRFICLATLLLQPELPSLIIIDEPEIGMHPYANVLLASMLQSVATKTQIIVATQSVQFINQFSPEDIVVVERENGASTFRRLAIDTLKDWLEDYTLGELWEKNVIGGRPS